jgi:hypothetical protein
MQEQLNDIKKNVSSLTTKMDKIIAIDAKRDLEIEQRLTKVEVRNTLLSKLTLLGLVAIVGSFFKDKLGM